MKKREPRIKEEIGEIMYIDLDNKNSRNKYLEKT